MQKQTITITVSDKELTFEPNTTMYHKYINEFMPNNKVSPAINYLQRIVSQNSKALLDEVLTLPGAAIQLADAVNERFAPQLEISIKNC